MTNSNPGGVVPRPKIEKIDARELDTSRLGASTTELLANAHEASTAGTSMQELADSIEAIRVSFHAFAQPIAKAVKSASLAFRRLFPAPTDYVDYAADIGLATEIDIRSIDVYALAGYAELRLWNHRRINIEVDEVRDWLG